jgi:hypothetical protein
MNKRYTIEKQCWEGWYEVLLGLDDPREFTEVAEYAWYCLMDYRKQFPSSEFRLIESSRKEINT